MSRTGQAGGGRRSFLRRVALALALLFLLFTRAGWAQLDVDVSGGALTLPEEAAAALEAWRNALPGEELPEPEARVAFAPELLGPDTLSLTLRWDDGRTEVLLAPERYRSGPVLVHELGVLLGLPASGGGVMDPALDADAPAAPTDEDLALLRELRSYPPEDITRDGAVDFYDLAALGAAWGSVGVNVRADLDGDGRVGEGDLAILQDAYTFGPPSQAAPSQLNLDPERALAPDGDPGPDPDADAGSERGAGDEGGAAEGEEDGIGTTEGEGDGDGDGDADAPDEGPGGEAPADPPPPDDGEGSG